MSKYLNKKCVIDGHKFDSLFEGQIYRHLLTLKCQILEFQPKIHMTEAAILYKPDFKCKDTVTGEIYYVEAKGFETAMWKLKKRLWKSYGPTVLWIYKKVNGRLSYERIQPL